MKKYDELHKLWQCAHKYGSPTKFVRNAVVYRALAALKSGETLDVGCGTGEHSIFLAKCGHRITAFDPSPYAIQELNKNIKSLNIKADINTIEEFRAPGLFDNIIAIEVMEHIEEDIVFAKKLYLLLKPGGSLILSVPATQFLYSDTDRLSGHYRRYAYDDLLKALKDAGFKHIHVKGYGFPVLFFYSILRKLFIDKILIKFFSSTQNQPKKSTRSFTKFYPLIFNIDRQDKPFWSVGFVATCSK